MMLTLLILRIFQQKRICDYRNVYIKILELIHHFTRINVITEYISPKIQQEDLRS